MELHQLRYFLAVVDHAGVTGAAGALGVSGPSVSTAVRGLERELGIPLFDRIGRGILPTSAGRALVGPARRTVRAVATAAAAAQQQEGELVGTLEIHTLPSLSTGTLSDLVARFCRRHPRVVVHLGRLGEESRTRSIISSGRCELVLTQLPFDAAQPRTSDQQALESVELGQQEYWIALPPGADAPPHDPIAWDEIPEDSFVVVPSGDRHVAELARQLATHGVRPTPAVIVGNREARMSFILAGVGGGFIERSLTGLARSRGAVVRALDPPLLRAFGLVFDPGHLSPAASAFLDLAREMAQPTPDLATSTKAAAAGES